MSRVVWKFSRGLHRIGDREEWDMPKGAEVLSVQNQNEVLTVWALCDPSEVREVRRFVILGTGHPVEFEHPVRFVGTVQFLEGTLVLHVWEVLG